MACIKQFIKTKYEPLSFSGELASVTFFTKETKHVLLMV